MLPADQEAHAKRVAEALWGSRGFARVRRRFTGSEKPDARGVIRPEGGVYAYQIGYYRKGKRGAQLSTVKGQSSVDFCKAHEDLRKNLAGTVVGEKLRKLAFGDENHRAGDHAAYKAMLLERHAAGLPLTKDAQRQVRRLKGGKL